jgi:hypothetical protein
VCLQLDSVSKSRYCPQEAPRTWTSATHPLVRLPGEGAKAIVVTLLLLLLLLPALRRVLELAAIWSA